MQTIEYITYTTKMHHWLVSIYLHGHFTPTLSFYDLDYYPMDHIINPPLFTKL